MRTRIEIPNGIFTHLAGDVDCLAVTGATAVVTGTITEGFDELGIDPIGERVSLVVRDQPVDSVDMDVSFVSGHAIPPCSAEPILTVVIDDGEFMVRPWAEGAGPLQDGHQQAPW